MHICAYWVVPLKQCYSLFLLFSIWGCSQMPETKRWSRYLRHGRVGKFGNAHFCGYVNGCRNICDERLLITVFSLITIFSLPVFCGGLGNCRLGFLMNGLQFKHLSHIVMMQEIKPGYRLKCALQTNQNLKICHCWENWRTPNLCGCFDHCKWKCECTHTPSPDQTPTNEQVQTTCK